jgi:hypothetical protein
MPARYQQRVRRTEEGCLSLRLARHADGYVGWHSYERARHSVTSHV